MAAGDLVQARLIGRIAGQTTITGFAYQINSATATYDDILGAINALIIPSILGWASADWIPERWDFNKLWPLPRTFTISQNIVEAALGTSPAAPPNVAPTITKQTAKAGRKWRGRVFLPGTPQLAIVNGQLTAAQTAALQNIATNMAAPLTLSGAAIGFPVVLSYSKTAVNTWSAEPIVACRANSIIRNQRRRQIGVGI